MIVEMFGRSSQAGASSSNYGYWPPETSPEQLLGYDEPRITKRCGLNDICWSSILRVDTLIIVSINSVKFACFSPYFCHDFALKVSPVLMFWIVHLPAVKKSTYMQYWNSVLFVRSTNFWMFDENCVPLLHIFVKLWHFKLCAVFWNTLYLWFGKFTIMYSFLLDAL